ncbi:hypothetical protein Moror_17741 [Moniliophthora roreri MCA 2997]|uniref:Impact N-terminal domain-containing protein n=2 Tax=Moniliophthora roreri TaxID=221103 RepID=V2XXN8_MONRO|nr:hypothetical protein Moror_17741 [Moniliophthora roreri MCA 2997]
MDAFVQRSRPLPQPIATSQEIRDRGSTFVARIYHSKTPEEARSCINYVRDVVHASKPATHEISAWRCMVPKPGKTGLGGPDDFELKSGNNDDGERWASTRVMKVMEAQAVIDAVVVVSRWYGGEMLGPIRFTHIETCTFEVCRPFKKKEELDDCVLALKTLDDTLAELRRELADLTAESSDKPSEHSVRTSTKTPDYSTFTDSDLPKAKRLVLARERAVTSVKNMIAKRRAAIEIT